MKIEFWFVARALHGKKGLGGSCKRGPVMRLSLCRRGGKNPKRARRIDRREVRKGKGRTMAYINCKKVMRMGRSAEGSLEIRPAGAGQVAVTFTPAGSASDGKSPHSIVLVVDLSQFKALLARDLNALPAAAPVEQE